MATGTAAEIRAKVANGNRLVEEAQHALRTATDKLGEAKAAYASIESSKLDGAINSASQAQDRVDEALTTTFGITAQADGYALTV